MTPRSDMYWRQPQCMSSCEEQRATTTSLSYIIHTRKENHNLLILTWNPVGITLGYLHDHLQCSSLSHRGSMMVQCCGNVPFPEKIWHITTLELASFIGLWKHTLAWKDRTYHLDSVCGSQTEKRWRVSNTQQVWKIFHSSKNVTLLSIEGGICQSWFNSARGNTGPRLSL